MTSENIHFDPQTTFNDSRLLHILLDTSNDYIYYKDKESRFIKINVKAAQALGANSPDEVIGKTDFDFFPEIAEQTRADEKEIIRTGKPQLNNPIQIRFADGTNHWVSVTKVPYYNEKGVIDGIVCISRDITKEKNNERTLEQQHEFLKNVLNSSPNCIYVKDKTGKYILANKAIAELYKTTPEEMIGKRDDDFANQSILQQDEAHYFVDIDKKTIETKQAQTIPCESFTLNDGTLHYFYTTKIPITYKEDPDCVMGISVDITQLKKYEEELKKGKEKFKNIFQYSNHGIALTDINGNILDINNELVRLLGYSKQELITMNFENLTHPDDIERETEFITNMMKDQKNDVRYQITKRYITKKGDILWVNLAVASIKNNEGQIEYIIGTITDITNLINIEEKLKKSQHLLEETEKISGIGGWEWDIKQNKANWTTQTYQMYGVDKTFDTSNLENILCFFYPNDRAIIDNAFQTCINQGSPYDLTVRFIDAKGNEKWVRTIGKPVYENGNIIKIRGNFLDVTKQKTADETLRRSEQRLKDAEKTARIGNVEWYCNTETAYWSDEIFELYERDKKLGTPSYQEIMELHEDEDAKKLEGVVQKAIQYAEPYSLDLKAKLPSGKLAYFHIIGEPIKDETGTVTSIKGTVQDITSRKIIEQKLHETTKHLEEIIQVSPSAIMTIDTYGNVTSWNPACEHIFGWEKEEVIGQFNPTVPKDMKEDYYTIMRRDSVNLSLKVFRKDNSLVDILLSTTPLYDNQGNFAGALGIMTDISKEKKAEEEALKTKKEMETLIKASSNGIRIISKDYKVKMMNETMAKMAHTTIKEGIGMKCSTMFGSKWCGTDQCSMVRVLKNEEKFGKEDERTNLQGTIVPCIDSVTPFYDEQGNLEGIIEDFRDITPIKEAEEEIKQLNRDLEKKVKERTERIEQILCQKDDFINQLGHDLKNPLGPLLHLLPILERKEKDPKQKELLQVVNRNVSYMKNLVIKTIQLAQLKSPNTALHCEKINLNKEFKKIIEANRIMFEEHHIQIHNNLTDDLDITADKLKLYEVFNNILNNAVKYSEKNGGDIIINAIKEDDAITISLQDTGIGMSTDQINKVFDEFYKADCSRHDFESSGLGMPICKRIIEKHGGRIWAESNGIGQGSTFSFTLPIEPKPHET